MLVSTSCSCNLFSSSNLTELILWCTICRSNLYLEVVIYPWLECSSIENKIDGALCYVFIPIWKGLMLGIYPIISGVEIIWIDILYSASSISSSTISKDLSLFTSYSYSAFVSSPVMLTTFIRFLYISISYNISMSSSSWGISLCLFG